MARQGGDHRRAAKLYEESLARWVALGDRRGIAGTIAGLAGLAGSIGVPRQAARLLGAAHAIGAGVGVHNLAHHFDYEQVVVATRTQLEERAFAEAWAAGEALSLTQAVAEAGIVAAMAASPTASLTETDEYAVASTGATDEASHAAGTPSQTNVIPLRPRARRQGRS